MRTNQIKNVSYLKERRKQLRNNLTPAEAALWSSLRNSQLKNRKFRRQHSIGNFIVDFYCPAEKIIIELDGEVHNEPGQAANDFERDEYLKSLGNKILRFENKLVFENMEGLLAEIAACFEN
jgi:very-short-patch-repair endonuclease